MKAFASIEGQEVIGGKLHITVDITLTDNAGVIVQNGKPVSLGGTIPRQHVPYTGSAAALVTAIATRAVGIAAGLGITLVTADVTVGPVQSA